jgi:hypothetical protein
MESKKEKDDKEEIITCVLYRNSNVSSTGLGSSYTVIFPEGYGMAMLRRFVYSSCKAIGVREEMKLMLECG